MTITTKITFGSASLGGGLTALEGLILGDTPATVGGGLVFGRTFEVGWESLLRLDANVVSVEKEQDKVNITSLIAVNTEKTFAYKIVSMSPT